MPATTESPEPTTAAEHPLLRTSAPVPHPPADLFSEIDPHESAHLYPSIARFDRENHCWDIRLRGAIFGPCPDDVRSYWVVRMLEWLYGASKLTDEELANFEARIRGFLSLEGGSRRVIVRTGPHVHRLPNPSRVDGHFEDSVCLPPSEIEQQMRWRQGSAEPWIDYELVLDANGHGSRRLQGRAQLIGPQGVSVISDIDDTIKRSEVSRTASLVRNTFFRRFEPVSRMADVYSRWAEQGAVFHYVSQSPYQLYEALTELLEDGGFPDGTVHLTTMRGRTPTLYGVIRYFLDLWLQQRKTKREAIEQLLRLFPERKFVLVGDSGQEDLDIYADVARRFPGQVARIFIRNLIEKPITHHRRRAAMRGLRPELLREYQDPRGIPWRLPGGSA